MSPSVPTARVGPPLVWLACGLFLGLQLDQAPLGSAPVGLVLLAAVVFTLLPLPGAGIWSRRLVLLLASLLWGALLVPDQPVERVVSIEARVQNVYASTWGQSLRLRQVAVQTGAPFAFRDEFSARAPLAPRVEPDDRIRGTGRFVWSAGRDGRLRSRLVLTELAVIQAREQGPRAWAWQAIAGLDADRALAGSLLLGRGRPPAQQAFKQAGLLHTLAVSGLHLGLALAGLAVLLRATGTPWWARQLGLAVLAGSYLWLTGGSIATQRATVMCWAIIACRLGGRRPHPLAGVSLAALVLMLLDPLDARSMGFQLSVAAVAGICTLGRDLLHWRRRLLPLRPWPLDRPTWLAWLGLWRAALDALLIGQAASLAVLPILAWYTGSWQPYAAVATVLATPLLMLFLLSGLAYLLLMGLWQTGPWRGLQWVVEESQAGLLGLVHWIGSWPGASLDISAPSPWCLLLWPLLFVPMRDRWDVGLRPVVLIGLVLLW